MYFDFQHILGNFGQFIGYIFSFAHLYKLSTSLAVFLLFLLLKNIFAKHIFNFLMKLCNKTEANTDEYILKAFENPLHYLIVLIGAYLALKNYLPVNYDIFLNNLLSSAVVIFIASGLHELVDIYANDEDEINRLFTKQVDKILIPFFSKVAKLIIIAMAFVVIASRWGYDVNGFIAGLGLGGLAFALAAKDLLANIFSGVVIITDKPFNIGDWIKSGDVEGIVQDINFRSTRIKRLDEAMVTVPNSSLVNGSITNFTKRTMRRVNFNLGVRYDTSSEKLRKCIERIELLLRDHPNVDKQIIFVKFDAFGDSALNIFVYFFTKTIVWNEYLNIKQDINFKIMEILEHEGVEIAFPSTSVYVETPFQIKNDDK